MRIAFVNQKGGAGKTTVAMLVASAIQQTGTTVALDDQDPQGSLTAWAIQVGGVPLLREAAGAAVVVTDTPGQLDLENLASRATKRLVATLEEADKAVLVTDLDFYSMHGAVPMAKFLREHARNRSWVLFNRLQERTLIGQQDRREIARDVIGLPALKCALPFSSAYRNAAAMGWKAVTGREREAVLSLAIEIVSNK